LAALDSVFQEMARGEAVGMGRIDVYVPSGEQAAPYYRWAVMTGGSKKDGFVCARMLSDMVAWPREHGRLRENKYARAPGTFLGLLFLFSAKDATPVAMINDGFLQHVRVGGGAGLGAKYLSRKDSSVVGMIGSGGMARTYLDAFCQVRAIKKVKVWSPNTLMREPMRTTWRNGTGSKRRLHHLPAMRCAAWTSRRAAPQPTSRRSTANGWSPACMSPTSLRANSSRVCRTRWT
jgi:alanine dehydrogenase